MLNTHSGQQKVLVDLSILFRILDTLGKMVRDPQTRCEVDCLPHSQRREEDLFLGVHDDLAAIILRFGTRHSTERDLSVNFGVSEAVVR